MKQGEKKYILLLAGMILIYVAYQVFGKKPYDWTVTLYSEDQDPFGTYVFRESLPDMFSSVKMSNATLYELADSSYQNLFILTTDFFVGDDDLNTMLNHAGEGRNIFISAEFFSFNLSDTLGFESSDYEIDAPFFQESATNEDSVSIRMTHSSEEDARYTYPVDNMYSQIDLFDSTQANVLARNDAGNAVLIHIPWGKGNIFINSTPMVFTNHFFLQADNNQLIGKWLSYLPENEIYWTEYYQVGRLESGSPLRYILSNPAVTWAYYLLIAGLVLFMVFEAKRRQRIIPVIRPLRNTTLDFVRTISNLYFQHRDHKNIAEKRISFFMDRLRRTYYLPENLQGRPLYEQVAAKSGQSPEEVEKLFRTMFDIRKKTSVTEEELKKLNTLIENFSI